MPTPLTEQAINQAVRAASAAAKQLELRDPGHRGLWLRVGKSGVKTWALRARDRAGKPHWFGLGRHPAMGLSAARRAALQMLAEVRGGANPIAERRLRHTMPDAAPDGASLLTVLRLYGEQRGADLRSWPESRKCIERVFAPLLPLSVAALTRAALQAAADHYPAKPSAALAIRTLRPALKWAARRELAPAALTDLVVPAAPRRRRRILSPAELAELLPVLTDENGAHAVLLRFLLLTLARLSEATQARWRDVDFAAAMWLLPNTKNGEPHRVPLSRQAIALLETLPAGAPGQRVFANAHGNALGNWDRVTKRLHALSGTTGWHRHDLRRTGATMLGEIGVEPHVIEASLNHVTIHSQLATLYNAARYRPQVACALQRLADTLDAIAAQP
jgi:integrase